MAKSENGAASRAMSNTCERRFRPKPSTMCPYTLDCCPDCGGPLRPFENPADVLQQVEITAKPTIVTEHCALAYWCRIARSFITAPLPEAVEKAGLFGPRLTALVAFMKGVCHASFSTIRKFLRDVVRVDVSRGYLGQADRQSERNRWPSRMPNCWSGCRAKPC